MRERTMAGGRRRPGRGRFGVALGLMALAAAACSEPVSPRDAAPAQPAAAAPDDYVATPAGLFHRSCVYQVPAGATVEHGRVVHLRGGTQYQVPACGFASRSILSAAGRPAGLDASLLGAKSPTVNGWVENTLATAGPYKRITADWTVPAAPQGSYTTNGKVYYTFPGLMSSTFIIQPVLQYGNNNSYGGAYWTITSWRCDSGANCFHSTPITVSPGNVIHGDVVASGCAGGNCTWTITTRNTSTGQQTVYTATDTENYWQAVSGAVEAYGMNQCNDYPTNPDYNSSGVFYSNVAVQDNAYNPVTPAWTNNVTAGLTPACGYRVTSTGTTASLFHALNVGATISGPTSVPLHQSPQYTASATSALAPLTYQWRTRTSPDGFSWGAWGSWFSTGTSNSTFTSVNSCGIRRNQLEVQVTDALGRTGIGDIYIDVSNPC